jgi:hypothetical protein
MAIKIKKMIIAMPAKVEAINSKPKSAATKAINKEIIASCIMRDIYPRSIKSGANHRR